MTRTRDPIPVVGFDGEAYSLPVDEALESICDKIAILIDASLVAAIRSGPRSTAKTTTLNTNLDMCALHVRVKQGAFNE
jgi:hypothetical protein